jgi:hypothetical protein
MQGYRNKQARLMKAGVMNVQEGSNYVSFGTYSAIAKRMLEAERHSSVFGWIYTVLAWNTIQRNETIASIMLEHLNVEGDSITVSVFASKSLH